MKTPPNDPERAGKPERRDRGDPEREGQQRGGDRGEQVKHDEQGRAVWQWASDTARNVALSTSQVLRRLEHHGLSLMDDSSTKRPMPGGASNPYESQPGERRPPAGGASRPPPKATIPRVPPAARAPSSWWRRWLRGG